MALGRFLWCAVAGSHVMESIRFQLSDAASFGRSSHAQNFFQGILETISLLCSVFPAKLAQ